MLTAAKQRRPVKASSRAGFFISTCCLDVKVPPADAITDGPGISRSAHLDPDFSSEGNCALRIWNCELPLGRHQRTNLLAHHHSSNIPWLVHIENDHRQV